MKITGTDMIYHKRGECFVLYIAEAMKNNAGKRINNINIAIPVSCINSGDTYSANMVIAQYGIIALNCCFILPMLSLRVLYS